MRTDVSRHQFTLTFSPMRAFLSIIALLMWEFLPIPIGTLPFAARNLLSASVWFKKANRLLLVAVVSDLSSPHMGGYYYLIVICSHQQSVFNYSSFRNTGSKSNDRMVNFTILHKHNSSHLNSRKTFRWLSFDMTTYSKRSYDTTWHPSKCVQRGLDAPKGDQFFTNNILLESK